MSAVVVPIPTTATLAVRPWPDPVIDALGHDPRSAYVEQLRVRARRLALSLVELGEDAEATERQLTRWKFHPLLCREAAAWAWDRHRQALAALEHADPPDDAA